LKTGIVLGGGSGKAFAHLGVLKALEEAGIVPDAISASSSGSIVGAFIASGLKPYETLELMKQYRFLDYVSMNLPMKGMLSLNSLERNLEKQLPAHTFAELELPLYVSVSNLNSGKVEYIHAGPLAAVIKAACSLPFVFSPVKLNGQLYLDGGLLDNLPYTPLVDLCDRIIVISISRTAEIKMFDNLKDIAARVIEMIVNQDSENAKRNSDLYIELTGMEDYKILDLSRRADEFYKTGYDYCKKLLSSKSIY
jgi:NTE family protein